MKVLFFLNHPAHFHLFKNLINKLKDNKHQVDIVIRSKDILEQLLILSKNDYSNLLPEGRQNSKVGIAAGILKKGLRLLKHCQYNKPDIMLGTSESIGHVGKLLKIPSINFSEDDIHVIGISSLITYSLSSHIVSPTVCDNGKWNSKTIFYDGYQKLAYLHPRYFTPKKAIVEKYNLIPENYYLLRLSKLSAHHDRDVNGITNELAVNLVNYLREKGEVVISSERDLPESLNGYLININPLDIHHILAYAKLFIGDSQSMTVESALLGTSSIRISDFVGKISVLEELEHKYKLTHGIKPGDTKKLFEILQGLHDRGIRDLYTERKNIMLGDKIDLTAFMYWLIMEYPSSVQYVSKNPGYQLEFIV